MTHKKFHLAWFTNFVVDEWNEPFASAGGSPWDGEFFVDFAKALERACFDYIMLEDTLMVSELYGGSSDAYLKGAIQVPKHDPAPLAALMGSETRNLGVVATMSTLGYPPFLLARLCATIDHIAGGRFGWNIVTSGEDAAAQNFGLDRLPEHDLCYEIADEYMDVVNRLFDSWDPNAIVLDHKTGTYAQADKVQPIHFEGKYFKCRVPVERGALTAGTADLRAGRRVATVATTSLPSTRNWVRRRRQSQQGRRRNTVTTSAGAPRATTEIRTTSRCSILFRPVMGETEAEAKAKYARSSQTAPLDTARRLGLDRRHHRHRLLALSDGPPASPRI